MVAILVRLKLSLLRNALRRSVWRTVGLIIGIVYALGVVAMALVGLVALRWTSVALTADVTVLAFAVLTAGWLLLSLLVFGIDETLDPSRFALLPVRAREIMPGLLVSGLISSTGLATVLVALGLLASWSRGVGPLLATVVAIPIGVATCFLLSRAGTAAFSAVLSSRRFRDFAFVGLAVLGLVFGVGANLVGGLLGQGVGRFRTLLSRRRRAGGLDAVRLGLGGAGRRRLGSVAARRPPAGCWLWPSSCCCGVVWGHYLGQRLTEPLEAARGAGRMRGGGWVDRLYPATPVGGVAARTLRYWRRDPRYVAGIAGFLIGPVILMVAQLANPDGQPLIAAFAPTLLCWLIGSSMAQDLSYDGSAIWVHADLRGARRRGPAGPGAVDPDRLRPGAGWC